MIQRIQSIFFLMVIVFQSILFSTALATFTSYESSFNLSIFGFYQLKSSGNEMLVNSYALMAVNIIIILFTLFIIFSYKNRKKQVRFAGLNLLLICTFIVLTFYSFDNAQTFLNGSLNPNGTEISTTYGIGMILPLLSLVFNFLAMRGIRKDEELIKSTERIR